MCHVDCKKAEKKNNRKNRTTKYGKHKNKLRKSTWQLWHDRRHSLLWVWMWVPVRGPLCLFWRETHTKGSRATFPTRPEENRWRQTTEESRREQGSRQTWVVSWREQSTFRERWLLGPVDPEAGLANVRGWVSVPGDFVGISLEYMLAIAHRSTEC